MNKSIFEAIDISEHNVRARKPIDWAAVRASGVSAVMIRIGWAGYEGEIAKNNALDDSLDASVRGAAAAGLAVGLYVYAYTKTVDAARVAARECVAIAKRYPGIITYPIAFDVEETKLDCLTAQGKKGLSASIAAFCDEVRAGGYYAVWYTYAAFIPSNVDVATLAGYDLWVANYSKSPEIMALWSGRERFGMWQYAGDADTYDLERGYLKQPGACPGVSGACDRNRVYLDYPDIIRKAGLNGLKNSGGTAGDSDTALRGEIAALRAQYDGLRAKYDGLQVQYDALRAGVYALSEKYR